MSILDNWELFADCKCLLSESYFYTILAVIAKFMKRIILYLLVTFWVLQPGKFFAQTSKPIKWSFSLSKTEAKQGEIIEVILKAEISHDWYLYSSDFDPDLGPTVTTLEIEKNETVRAIGSLKPIGAKEKYDSIWGGKIRYFTKHAEFRQKVMLLKVNPTIKGTLIYQVCSDKEGKCIPFEETILLNKIKVTPVEFKPEKTEVKPPAKIDNIPTKDSTSGKDNSAPSRLAELEQQKEQLIEREPDGTDRTINQLKSFSQKYGGGK
jgi:hypothetical protein